MAFAADVGASWGLFTLGAAALAFTVQLVTGTNFSLDQPPVRLTGRRGDLGVHLLRLPVGARAGRPSAWPSSGSGWCATDGSPIGARQAVLRTLALPLSFLLLGLGFLGILTNRDRHALHDRLAGTAVVYSWDARAARLRWLARQDAPPRPDHGADAAATAGQLRHVSTGGRAAW